MASAPDVSVIIIVYNDAKRIERAVRSVLDQSLRNCEVLVVDDASTDDSPHVVARLVAAAPERMRSIRLEANSGGCGKPRNTGIDAARGRYVMFLDSDDTLDRHACRNLFATAEETGADLVSGRCVRYIVETGAEQVWKAPLFERRAVYESLAEAPHLLQDLLSTNKMYRRDFLNAQRLRFPEDRLYEDMLFATHAYLTANRLAVIPHRVYNWYVEKKATDRSISNRPTEMRNVVDRISINRDMDELLAKYGNAQLQLAKDIRFIQHDLRVHLAELPDADPEHQARVVEAAAPYLADLDPGALTGATGQLFAIAAYFLGRNDIDGVRSAVQWAVRGKRSRQLRADLAERDGRIYWSDRYLDDETARAILDVTALGLHDRPLAKLHLGTKLTAVAPAGSDGKFTIAGDMVNPLGRIKASGKLKAVLRFNDRRNSRRTFTVPVTLEHDDRRLRWQARFNPLKALRPVGLLDTVWTVRLRLTTGGETVDLQVFADRDQITQLALPVRPRAGRLTADRLEAYQTENGHLAFRLTARDRAARTAAPVLNGLRSTAAVRAVWDRSRALVGAARERASREQTKLDVYDRVLTRLPLRRDTVVFESAEGRSYAGSPRYVYEELRRTRPEYKAIWVHAGKPEGFPEDAQLVARGSWAYYRAVAQAGFWVDDSGFPPELGKREGTTYIQTWHASPYRRAGFHDPENNRLTAEQQQPLQTALDRFDAFLVRSEYEVRTLVRGLRLKADLVRAGHPRNDPLVRGGDPAVLAALRERFGAEGRRVFLYAPADPPGPPRRGVQRFEVPFDLGRFQQRYGDDTVLLVLPPRNTDLTVPPAVSAIVRDASPVTDTTSLLLLADALITDESPVMFDYALLDRPIVVHRPTLPGQERDDNGAYFDLAAKAPGPLTYDDDQLFTALDDLSGLAAAHADARRRFAAEFGEYDTGHAAETVVARFFTREGRRG
jgi:CDP-glycerol glycerophosphotransferase